MDHKFRHDYPCAYSAPVQPSASTGAEAERASALRWKRTSFEWGGEFTMEDVAVAVAEVLTIAGAGAGAVASTLRPTAGAMAEEVWTFVVLLMTPFKPFGKNSPLPLVAPAVTMEVTCGQKRSQTSRLYYSPAGAMRGELPARPRRGALRHKSSMPRLVPYALKS